MNETKKGIQFFKKQIPYCKNKSDFVKGHNWFHLGLFYADKKKIAKTIDIFDRHIWREKPESVYQHTDIIIALWRLELEGHSEKIKDKWEALKPFILEKSSEHVFPFLNITYIYALKRAKAHSAAESVLEKMKEDRVQWKIGYSIAEGIIAFCDDDFAKTLFLLEPHLNNPRIGGSDEQRAILMKTFETAKLKGALSCKTLCP